MHIDVTVNKLPEEMSEGENSYEAFAVSDKGIAMGAVGKNPGSAIRALYKKLKEMRRFILTTLPILEIKQGLHTYNFKINTNEK